MNMLLLSIWLNSDTNALDLHGNADDGSTAVMGTVVAVTLWKQLLLKRFYRGSGHGIL